MDSTKEVFDLKVTIDQMSQTISKMERERFENVKEIERVRKEREKELERFNNAFNRYDEKLEEFKKTLAFYADDKNYSYAYQPTGELADDSEINKDRGFLAEQALKEE